MKRRIAIEDLKIGMYVSDLDRSELAMSQGFWIRSQAQINKLRRYCKHVYIETPETYPYPGTRRPSSGKWPPSGLFSSEDQKKLEFEILKLSAAPHDIAAQYQDQVTLEEEINNLRPTYNESRALTRTILRGVRDDKRLDVTAVKKVAGQFVESVLRNGNGLVCFAQLRRRADYTSLHSVRTCLLALTFGRHLALKVDDLYLLGIGTLLQDIGKAKVPVEILDKPQPLTNPEFQAVKRHVQWGVDVVRVGQNIPEPAIEVVRFHHERYDGSGYPNGLKGDQIPLLGQIGAIVDCYDALTSDRAYSAAISAHNALMQIYESRDKEFDAALVEKFIQCLGIYPIGSLVELNTGDVGVVITVNRARRLKPKVRLALTAEKTVYRPPRTINLMSDTTNDDQPFEIDRVLDPGAYGINPVHFLPVRLHH
ncbi:MAG: HD-GYP domain-containing protein [Acidiferrobacterales bacterium]